MNLASYAAVFVVAAGLLLAGCGEETTVEQKPGGGLAACLEAADFKGSDEAVATVIIDGADEEAVVKVPGRESEFAVIYKAPSSADAQRLAAEYDGGPFAAAVGDRIYTFTSDEPTAAQRATFERCLA